MKQPEELSAYKESVLQDIAQAQRVGADENAITALISQYPLDQALAAARADVFRDMESAVPDPRLVEIFQLKYDYHNGKTLLKAAAMGRDPQSILLPGVRVEANARVFQAIVGEGSVIEMGACFCGGTDQERIALLGDSEHFKSL